MATAVAINDFLEDRVGFLCKTTQFLVKKDKLHLLTGLVQKCAREVEVLMVHTSKLREASFSDSLFNLTVAQSVRAVSRGFERRSAASSFSTSSAPLDSGQRSISPSPTVDNANSRPVCKCSLLELCYWQEF